MTKNVGYSEEFTIAGDEIGLYYDLQENNIQLNIESSFTLEELEELTKSLQKFVNYIKKDKNK